MDGYSMICYASLYHIVRQKSVTIATVLTTIPSNVSFPRALVGQNLTLWYNLVASILHVQLSADRDIFKWSLTNFGQFSINFLSIRFRLQA